MQTGIPCWPWVKPAGWPACLTTTPVLNSSRKQPIGYCKSLCGVPSQGRDWPWMDVAGAQFCPRGGLCWPHLGLGTGRAQPKAHTGPTTGPARTFGALDLGRLPRSDGQRPGATARGQRPRGQERAGRRHTHPPITRHPVCWPLASKSDELAWFGVRSMN